MQQIIEMAKSFDWSPFWISLKTGIVATVSCFFLGLFAARKVLKLGPKARAVIDGILTLPMVMAPTVAGFFLQCCLPASPLRHTRPEHGQRSKRYRMQRRGLLRA